MEWTDEKVVRLIEMLKNCPPLYDIRRPEYRNRGARKAELRKLAAALEISGNYRRYCNFFVFACRNTDDGKMRNCEMRNIDA